MKSRFKKVLTHRILYRILHRMKVTANLPDKLIFDVKELTQGKNITDSIELALSEWTKLAKLKKLNLLVQKKPFSFSKGFSAATVRKLNQNKK